MKLSIFIALLASHSAIADVKSVDWSESAAGSGSGAGWATAAHDRVSDRAVEARNRRKREATRWCGFAALYP